MSLRIGAIWIWHPLHLCDIHSQQWEVTGVIFLSLTSCLWGAEDRKLLFMNTERIGRWNSLLVDNGNRASILLLSGFIHDGENVPNWTFPNSTNTEVTNLYSSPLNCPPVPPIPLVNLSPWIFYSHPSIHSFSVNCLEMSNWNLGNGDGWSLSQLASERYKMGF